MKTLFISFRIIVFFTITTGILYTLLITGIAQVVFPGKANGSLIRKDNKVIGSALIGQQFDSTIYFSSRPSATRYNPLPSGATNLGITNPTLIKMVRERKIQFIAFNHLDITAPDVPAEMLFASASGLDPHISPKSAMLQVNRIANARNLNDRQRKELEKLLIEHTERQQYYCLGVERVNVLLLNLSLDEHFGR
jgi:K+-transporting ATPase ATPase C chain